MRIFRMTLYLVFLQAHGLLSDASIGADIKYIIQKLLILQQDMVGLEK